jgi:N-acetylglucosamine malate deacetylase 1
VAAVTSIGGREALPMSRVCVIRQGTIGGSLRVSAPVPCLDRGEVESLIELASRALVLGAHADDEFGCAGTIARMIESGAEVHYACFSSCEESVPEGWPPDVLRREVRDAIKVLGIAEENFHLFDFRVRHFPTHRQELLEELVKLRKEIDPQLVFLPAMSDMHQDHGVVAREGLRAFKHATVLGYELPMNTISFQHVCFIRLEERHMQVKMDHAATYKSQASRSYLQPEFIRALAMVRGVQINQPAAEAFEVIRAVIM